MVIQTAKVGFEGGLRGRVPPVQHPTDANCWGSGPKRNILCCLCDTKDAQKGESLARTGWRTFEFTFAFLGGLQRASKASQDAESSLGRVLGVH